MLEASEKNYPLWRGSVLQLTFKSVGESDYLQPHPIIHNCGIHIRDHKTQHMNYKIGMTTSPMIRQCGVPCSQKECSSWWPALLVLPSLASIGPASCNLCALYTDVTWTPSPVTITSICKILKIYYKWRVRLVHDNHLMFWSCHPSVDAQLVSSPATPWLLNFSERQPKRQDVSWTTAHWLGQDFQLCHLHRQGQRGQGHLCK